MHPLTCHENQWGKMNFQLTVLIVETFFQSNSSDAAAATMQNSKFQSKGELLCCKQHLLVEEIFLRKRKLKSSNRVAIERGTKYQKER
jgi:hypothetical protein